MTIEARSATRLGRGVEQRLLDLQAAGQVRRGGRVGRDQPAEVDDAPHAGGARGRGEALRGRRSRSANVPDPVGAGLHRVDEEVGDVDAVERLVEPVAGHRVAADDLGTPGA